MALDRDVIVPVKAVRQVLKDHNFRTIFNNKLTGNARSIKVYGRKDNSAVEQDIHELMDQYGIPKATNFKQDGYMVYTRRNPGYRGYAGTTSLIVRLKGDEVSALKHVA